MAEIAKSKSISAHGQPVSVTVHSVGATKPGVDTTGFGQDIEPVKIGKPGKEKSKEKSTDGQRSADKSESQKLKDHVLESTSASKMKAAAGDFDTNADKSSKEKPDSMTDMAQGRSFKPRQSGAQQRKKAKEKANDNE